MSTNLKTDEEKIRVNITFPKSLMDKLRDMAKAENRSLNMQVITILQKYLEGGG